MFLIADRQSQLFHAAREDISVIVSPIEFVVNWPIQLADNVAGELSTHQMLLQQNAKYKAESLFLEAKVQKMLAIENENKQLRQLLQSSATAGGQVHAAQIIAVAPDPFMHQVVVDRGSMQHVYQGQPVLDASGVMGQIVQVGKLTSRVMLVTDSNSAIPIQDSRSGVRAIAVGDSSSGDLHLINVMQSANLKKGDLLIASGLGQDYPFGYPVGTISAVKQEIGNQFLTVLVKPSAHLNRSRLVLLVWPAHVKIDKKIEKVVFKSKQKKVR